MRKRQAAAGVIAEEGANLQRIVRTLAQHGAELPVEAIGEGPDGAQQQAQVAARAGREKGRVSHCFVSEGAAESRQMLPMAAWRLKGRSTWFAGVGSYGQVSARVA